LFPRRRVLVRERPWPAKVLPRGACAADFLPITSANTGNM
jgi:hypothetical protein